MPSLGLEYVRTIVEKLTCLDTMDLGVVSETSDGLSGVLIRERSDEPQFSLLWSLTCWI